MILLRKITSMICLTSHVKLQKPNSSVMLTKQYLMRTRTLTQSHAVKYWHLLHHCSTAQERRGLHDFKWLAYIINIAWINKTIPDDWRRGIMFPFWKNKGNKEVCSNHRGITLLSIPGKLFAIILLDRIRPIFHNHRRSEQASFTAGRSTTEHIFAIRQIIEKSKECNTSTYIAFIDFKAAFDSVSRDCLENSSNLRRSTGTFCSCASIVQRHPQRGATRLFSVRRVFHRDWRDARLCHCTRPLQLCNRPPNASAAESM